MISTLTWLVLNAAPLNVRILEKEHPTRAHVEATRIQCDGAVVAGPLELSISEGAVKIGSRSCTELVSLENTRIRVGTLERNYSDTVSIQVEGRELRFINRVDVEDYLPGVVAAEIGDAPAAAQQAQAIVSRTFALASRKRHASAGFDLCDLAHCQAYRGQTEATQASREAVTATAKQVLLQGGVALKPTWFHAACGGTTSTALDVFHEDVRTVSVSDAFEGKPACSSAPDFNWHWELPTVDLQKAIGGNAAVAPFAPLKRDAGGRVMELTSFGKRFSGTEFASLVGKQFGWLSLRSLRVTVTEVEGTLTFQGTGSGHGVGLCQAGARRLAEKKQTATQILKRYYPESLVRPFE